MTVQESSPSKQALNKGTVVPRNIDFELDEGVSYDWHSKDPGVSNFWNALSLLFPEGEEFFVQSARGLAKHVKDPDLKKDLRGFMTQEMLHTREHVEYNNMLKRHGIKTDRLNGFLKWWAVLGHRRLPKKAQLAITVSAEHWTATLAELVLDTPEAFDGADPKMKALWNWHAIEETEHKAVCFDLLREVCRDEAEFNRLRRVVHGATVVPGLMLVFGYYFAVMQHTGQLGNMKAHRNMLRFNFRKPGLFGKVVPLWLQFFDKDFHPWDRDNRDKITAWDEASPDRDHYPEDMVAAE